MQKVLILDFGGKYNQSVARAVRRCRVYCEVHPAAEMDMAAIRAFDPIGMILIGGTQSVHNAPRLPAEFWELDIPMLGIGYGCGLMAQQLGGTVSYGLCSEPGRTLTTLDTAHVLFSDLSEDAITWMDCANAITALPEGFTVTAHTAECPIAAFCCPERKRYGVRFHPEVAHTGGGSTMIGHFLKQVCGAYGEWYMEHFASIAVEALRQRIGSRRVLLALSGGVDSSVAAALLNRAVGSQLTCIFVDHGMLRKDEGDQVEAVFSRMDLHFIRVNAADAFLRRLEGVTDPEEKRAIIGEEFVRVFETEAKKLGTVDFLAQGTIYPDIVEAGLGYADVIRSSRNMDSLPEHIDFKELLEPLRMLFKEEVRELGRTMGLPEPLVNRQPFPGPGLAIRIVGSVTEEKLAILQEADHIFTAELEHAHRNGLVGQYFAVLTDTQTVSVTNGEKRQDYTLALRAVTTDDFMTAKWARLPYELLDKLSEQLIRSVRGINRVVYDITNKPPATIEWE